MSDLTKPESVVVTQLEAYNARDIDTFMSCWHEDAEYFEHPDTLLARGAAAIRERHLTRFKEPDLHGRLTARVSAGNLVVDHEVVTRNFPEGRGTVEVVAIYEVRDGKIARAWFKMGARVLEAGSDWEERVRQLWLRFRSGALTEDALIPAVDAIAAERSEDDAAALFERASARDSVGLEADADVLYRRALAAGLDADRRARATIQLASTLRNLGRLDESEALLRAHLALPDGQLALADEARAFLALTLADRGVAREAVGHAVLALAPHLSRYNRSAANYAAELLGIQT